MSKSDPQKSHYDNAFEVLTNANYTFQERGIPIPEVPPAVADYLIMFILAVGEIEGNAEQAVLAIIERQLALLDAWREGRLHFKNPSKKNEGH